jgi:hypothetical protein
MQRPRAIPRPGEPVEAERLVGQAHSSGIRPIVEPSPSEAFSFDPHNAVTTVQEAINLDAFLAPTVEVTVAVSQTISLGPSQDAPGASSVHTSPTLAPAAPPIGAHDADATPPPSARSRKASARIVLAVMVAAIALLVVAVIRAPGAGSQALMRLARGIHLVR